MSLYLITCQYLDFGSSSSYPARGAKRMSDRKPHRKSGSFSRGVILALVFCLLYFLYSQLSKRGLPQSLADLVGGEGREQSVFLDSTQSNTFYRGCAGFWSADYVQSSDSSTYRIRDMIEFKDNGIVWRVLAHHLVNGTDTIRGVHTMDAYVRPFKWIDDERSMAQCDVRVLRQARAFVGDTCYGPENSDVVWLCGMSGEHFRFRGVPFERYSGDLGSFFPKSAIRLLEQGYERVGREATQSAYQVTTNYVSLRKDAGSKAYQITLSMHKCGQDWWFGTAADAETQNISTCQALLGGLVWLELPEHIDSISTVEIVRSTGPARAARYYRADVDENAKDTLSALVSRYAPSLSALRDAKHFMIRF